MDLKQLTIKEFDKAAEQFDDDSISVYNLCRKDYPHILNEIDTEPWQSVLDAGCGTGAVIYILHEKYPDKSYTGIDLSEKMIEVAGKKNIDGVTFVQGDCEELPFAGSSFDVVICSQSFHHYTNPQKFFNNVSRVLKPDGRLILRDMSTSIPPLLWFFNHIEMPVINHVLHKGDVHVYNKKEIEELCKNSGMRLEKFENMRWFRMHCVCRKV